MLKRVTLEADDIAASLLSSSLLVVGGLWLCLGGMHVCLSSKLLFFLSSDTTVSDQEDYDGREYCLCSVLNACRGVSVLAVLVI